MITGAQIRAARALLRWNAEDLAAEAKLGIATVRRAEAVDGQPTITEANGVALQRALENKGVVFIPENGDGPGVRLRKAKPESTIDPKGPATDAIAAMDQAIEAHKAGVKRRRSPLKTKGE